MSNEDSSFIMMYQYYRHAGGECPGFDIQVYFINSKFNYQSTTNSFAHLFIHISVRTRVRTYTEQLIN